MARVDFGICNLLSGNGKKMHTKYLALVLGHCIGVEKRVASMSRAIREVRVRPYKLINTLGRSARKSMGYD
jgi:hypothetical protein